MLGWQPILLLGVVCLAVEVCGLVRQCPFNTMCSCRYGDPFIRTRLLTQLTCIQVPFSKLPDLPPGNLSSMNVVGSDLEFLMSDSFGDVKTEELSLMSNRIISIQEDVFLIMLNTLQELDLSFNKLQDVPIEALSNLRKLKKLNLDSNEISTLRVKWNFLKETLTFLYVGGNDIYFLPSNPDYSLLNFKKLTQIYLDRNYLSNNEANFNSLPASLRTLSISDNLFTEFPSTLLDNLKDLSRLYFQNNYISELTDYNYKGRINLEALDLSNNLIHSVNNFFGKYIKVKDLNLSLNNIDQISPQAFNGYLCNKIDISFNKLQNLNEKTFIGLEYSLENLNLSHNRFTKIPKVLNTLKHLMSFNMDYNPLNTDLTELFLKNSSQSLRRLSLVGTGLSTFPKNIKNFKKLSTLNLGYNKIAKIEENDFSKWSDNLDTLLLQSNSITRLNDGTFKYLRKLTELSLSFNQIDSIEDKVFTNLGEQLQTLDVSFGLKIDAFPETALKPLTSLLYLALDNNNISSLQRTAIYGFPNLQYLILDFNKIYEIPESFFHSNVHKYLKDVRLSFNQLYSIKPHTFTGLEELHFLILNNNYISIIHESSFKNLPNTLRIILSNNKINHITSQAFINVPNLIELDLHNNNIQEFSFNIFQNVTNDLQPMTLNLRKNRIEKIFAGDILNPVYLKVLDLSHNKLDQIPSNLMMTLNTSLRKLDLRFNKIRSLETNEFLKMEGLDTLCLQNNGLISLKPSSFHGLKNLQLLNLSHNHLELLYLGQFKNLHSLRILDLSYNHLRSIPNEAFRNTKLEKLILSNNVFVVLPTSAFVEIGYSLRSLDVSYNQIETLDNDLRVMPLLNEINLCYNKLLYINDNVFRGLSYLVRLELCGNKLTLLSKNLFQYVQSVRYLNLGEIGLNEVPFLQLPHLVWLSVSQNNISVLSEAFLFGLPKLRELDLSHNTIAALNGIAWKHSPNLRALDLSNNPVKILTKDSFHGLKNVNNLNLQYLNSLERFDSDTLSECILLRSLKIQTWPRIEKYRFRLARIISNLKHLKRLSVLITDEKLTDQLAQSFPEKLDYLEITGRNLVELAENSLDGLEESKNLHLRISSTSIKSFPKQFFWKLTNNKLTLDLSNNKIEDIGPEVFYKDRTMVGFGTNLYPGGINLQGNPLICGCNSKWLGNWMKRYLVESVKINTNKPEFNQQIIEEMILTSCYYPDIRKMDSILTFDQYGCIFTSSSSNTKPNIIVFIIMVSLLAFKFDLFRIRML